MAERYLMRIILPRAHASKPAQCLQLPPASAGCSNLLRRSSVHSETENILTNSPLIIPSSLCLICKQLHSAWEDGGILIFTFRSYPLLHLFKFIAVCCQLQGETLNCEAGWQPWNVLTRAETQSLDKQKLTSLVVQGPAFWAANCLSHPEKKNKIHWSWVYRRQTLV